MARFFCNSNLKKIVLGSMTAALLWTGAQSAFAQNADSETEEDLLLEEAQSILSANGPDPSIQRPISIVASVWDYDLNPQTASYAQEAQVLTGLYEGLFSYHPYTVEAIPAICQDYKISRDKKRWTFTLRDDARFSNGEPITAQTMVDSWFTMLSNPDASFASLLECVEGVSEFLNGTGTLEDIKISARDEHTLVVHVTTPTQHLPQILCHHAFAAVSSEPGVYSGAFTLESWENGILVLKKNPFYHDASHVYIPEIRITQLEDSEEATYMFNTGAADWISKNVDTSTLLDEDTLQLNTEFGTQYLFFKDNKDDSPWTKVEFRRALVEAVPYDRIRESSYIEATTLVYPLSGYPEVSGFDDYNTEDAIEMMNDAREQYGIPLEQKLSLTIAISAGNSYERTIAEQLKAAWKPLGVTVKIQTTSAARYTTSIPSWNADLFIYGWVGDYADPMAFLELFRGNSSMNPSGYCNPVYDGLLKQAAEAEDTREHYKYLSQAEQILIDEGEVIPISHFIAVHAINTDEIGGWYRNALDIHPLRYLYIKPVECLLENVVMKF